MTDNNKIKGISLETINKMNHIASMNDFIDIWCNASNFADRYDLTGFFTSMFISNSEELIDCGFSLFDNCDDEITRQNQIFASRINNLLVTQTPTRDWARILYSSLINEERFVYYNYEAMYSTEDDN